MRIICISRFRCSNPDGGMFDFEPGQDVDVSEEMAGLLLRRSPGSFKVPTPEKPEPEPEPEPDLSAMSTETATGLVAPDRRARGGKKRGR